MATQPKDVQSTEVTYEVKHHVATLTINRPEAQNTISGARNNGIEILRHQAGDDGTLVMDNRIEDIVAGPGGTGQHGNAINAFRAANVIVRGNRIRNCDFSGVRGNSASNIQIIGNSMTDVREVAIYSEFSFEGAVIAFAVTGYIFWTLGLFMAAANFAGGQLGARIALRYGNDFIRAAFYVVVALLIAKTFRDAYL